MLLRGGAGSERRWVRTGGQDEGYWEIADGLREGDEVLVGETKPEGKENAGP